MTFVIDVDGDWAALDGATPIGRLVVARVRGTENFFFSYQVEWLRSSQFQLLDPALRFYAGPQYPSDPQRANFGFFLDSSPDRQVRGHSTLKSAPREESDCGVSNECLQLPLVVCN